MKSVRNKVLSCIMISSMVASCFMGIPVYANDYNDKNITSRDDNLSDEYSNETVRLLIELDKEAAIAKSDSNTEIEKKESSVKEEQKDIIDKVQKITGSEVKSSFGYLINGFVIEGKRKDINEISKINGVKSVKESIKMKSNMTTSNILTEAQSAWSNLNIKGEGMVVSIIDTGVDTSHNDFKNIESKDLKITKEDALKKISDLGYGKYFSDKIPFGYNYADNNDDVKNENQDHGMHVSGIACADGQIKGVANESQLLAMRVATDDGYFFNDDVLRAIEDSVKLGADVINMSFGNDSSYLGDENLYKSAIENASKKGVICVNACGNAQTSSAILTSSSLNEGIQNNLNLKDDSVTDVTSLDSFSVASMDNIKDATIKEDISSENPKMSSYTSWGPSPDLELKPEITAPGGNIKSTLNDNTYGEYSGTSMASPNVAGGSALVSQSLKEKQIEVSDDKKVQLIKNLIMNTATPLIDSTTKLPYSPRQQGAGLMQIEKAAKNNVTVTDSRGKAYIALKNINQNKVTFEMDVVNYGKSDASYTLKNEDLYTEQCKNNINTEKKIDGAEISFDKSSLTVKAGSKEKVIGTLTLPDNFTKQNFVEGYISIHSTSKDVVDISVPVMGFYGDYGDETIIDSPIFDKTDSKVSVTGLGEFDESGKFNYYGNNNLKQTDSTNSTKLKDIDSNKVAFSPNGDGNKDKVELLTYFLRNAKEYKAEVLDKDKNIVGNIKEFKDVTKDLYSNYSQYGVQILKNHDYSWDGTYYDNKSGTYKKVNEGQYYVRLIASGYTDNAKEQVIDMPVKVDDEKPDVQIQNVKTTKSSNKNILEVSYKASDNLSGLSKNQTITVNNDSSTTIDLSNAKESDGIYTAKFQVGNRTKINDVTISVEDNAGNRNDATYGNVTTENEDANKPVITNISKYKEGSITTTDESSIEFAVLGEDENDAECILKNITTGQSYTNKLDSDGQAIVEISLADGANLMSVVLKDDAGNYSDYKYFTVVHVNDLNALSVGFINLKVLSFLNGTDTADGNYLLKGYVTKKPDKLTVNGQDVNVKDNLSFEYNTKFNQGANNVTLSYQGTNTIEDYDISNMHFPFPIGIFDSTSSNNKKGENVSKCVNYRVYYDSVAPTLKIENGDTIKVSKDADSVTIKGSVTDNNNDYYVIINGNQVLNTDVNNMQPASVKDSSALNRNLSQKVSLTEGNNIITIDAVDIMGNKTEKKINVIREEESSKSEGDKPETKVDILQKTDDGQSKNQDKDNKQKIDPSSEAQSKKPSEEQTNQEGNTPAKKPSEGKIDEKSSIPDSKLSEELKNKANNEQDNSKISQDNKTPESNETSDGNQKNTADLFDVKINVLLLISAIFIISSFIIISRKRRYER